MKRALRVSAVILLLASMGLWLAKGANRGWTKTSVPTKTLDDVTGIEGVSYRPGFIPGADFLAATMAASGFLAAGSLFIRNKRVENRDSVSV
jgi:hypothetical protein